MGIKDLLRELRSITTLRHLREYKGLRAGVDIMCWMHKGIHRCIGELINGEETVAYVEYCMEMISLLELHEIKPFVILDGRKLRAKSEKNLERKRDRDKNRKAAHEAFANEYIELAHTLFKKSVGITSEMIYKLIRKMREEGVDFLVSPYEADAQLAYLSINGIIDLVITEDSDALVYGCSRILFKLNRDTHSGYEIVRKNMGNVEGLSFANWTDDQFKLFACLAGSDYQKKLHYMGIKTAYQYARKYKTYDGICSALRQSRFSEYATSEFFRGLKQAWLTFKHQLVFDEASQKCVHLTPVPEDNIDDINDLTGGELIEQDVLLKLVKGVLDPYTLSPFEHNCVLALNPTKATCFEDSPANTVPHKLRNFDFSEIATNKLTGICSGSTITGERYKKRGLPWAHDILSYNPELIGVVRRSKDVQHNKIELSPMYNSFHHHDDTWIEKEDCERAIDSSSNKVFDDVRRIIQLDKSRGRIKSREVDVITNFLPRKLRRSMNEAVVDESSSMPVISCSASGFHFGSSSDSLEPQPSVSAMSFMSSCHVSDKSSRSVLRNDCKCDNIGRASDHDPRLQPEHAPSTIDNDFFELGIAGTSGVSFEHKRTIIPVNSRAQIVDLLPRDRGNKLQFNNRAASTYQVRYEPECTSLNGMHLRKQSSKNQSNCEEGRFLTVISGDTYVANSIRYSLSSQ